MKTDQAPAPTLTCPIELALLVMGDKWKVVILRELFRTTRRFNELMRRLKPISQKMLAQQLRSMEEDGLVLRTQYLEIPPRVEYTLTPFGRSLGPVLAAMGEWGIQSQEKLAHRYPSSVNAPYMKAAMDDLRNP
ncbi:MAG: helix-turn-helix transcriptional regulator [Ruminococcaceae bacterium]|nr:helix-turn-helix transcriptional regulator [Oscillospiraceae bacterium]